MTKGEKGGDRQAYKRKNRRIRKRTLHRKSKKGKKECDIKQMTEWKKVKPK